MFAGQLLFATSLPPASASQYHVYFGDGGPAQTPGSQRGSGLVDSAVNLVVNPSFESGGPLPDGWTASGAAPQQGIVFGRDAAARDGLGTHCAKLHVPAAAPKGWRGWQQDVPVKPGRTYLLAAWVKCQDVRGGEVRLHAHRRTAGGELSQRDAFASVGPSISGTSDWTLMSGTLRMSDDTATLQVHLTMDASGTLWHDGVLLVEVFPGVVTGFEGRSAAADDGVAVWQVPAVVKVFQDDPPPARPSARGASGLRWPRPRSLRPATNRSRCSWRCTARDIADVAITVEPPVGPRGFVLKDLRVEVVGYVPIDYPSSYYQTNSPAWHRKVPSAAGRGDGWAGLWPDPLLPRQRVRPAGRQHAAHLDYRQRPRRRSARRLPGPHAAAGGGDRRGRESF